MGEAPGRARVPKKQFGGDGNAPEGMSCIIRRRRRRGTQRIDEISVLRSWYIFVWGEGGGVKGDAPFPAKFQSRLKDL